MGIFSNDKRGEPPSAAEFVRNLNVKVKERLEAKIIWDDLRRADELLCCAAVREFLRTTGGHATFVLSDKSSMTLSIHFCPHCGRRLC